MPYREVKFFSGGYYHIYSRGNEKREIFIDKKDYERFLSRLEEYKEIHKVSIICYCLMPNHYHFILRQNTEKSLSFFLHRLMVSYSMYFNKRYKRVGHLFQGNFKAKLIDKDEYLLHLSRYIHLNPLEISSSKSDLRYYPWSSYLEFIGEDCKQICEKDIILDQFSETGKNTDSYRKFIEEGISEAEFRKIKDFVLEI